MSDVYLSYLDVDRALAMHVREVLEQHGISCRMQLVDAPPEAMLADFRSALAEVPILVAVVTRACLGDPLAGFVAATDGWRGKIVLVVADDVSWQDLPAPLQMCPGTSPSRLDRLAELLMTLRTQGRPSAPPVPAGGVASHTPPAAPALPRFPAAHDGPRPDFGVGGAPAFPAAKPAAAAPPARMPEFHLQEQEREVATSVGAAVGSGARSRGPVNAPLALGELMRLSDVRLSASVERNPNRFEDVLSGRAVAPPSPPPVSGPRPPPPSPPRPAASSPGAPVAKPAGEIRKSATQPSPPPLPSQRPALDRPSLDSPPPDHRAPDRRRDLFPPQPAPQARNPAAPEQGAPPRRPPAPPSPPEFAPQPMADPHPAPAAARGPAKSAGGGGVVGVLAMVVAALLGAVLVGTATGQGVLIKLMAALGMKLNAFGFFGFRSRKDEPPTPPQTDLVDCSVFAPPVAAPGATVLVQVFLHTAKQAERAQFMATVMDATTSFKGVQTLQTEIARGARVGVTLSGSGLAVEEPAQTLVWRGEPVFAQFLVTLPAGVTAATFHAVARISVEGGLVGRIVFAIAADPTVAGPTSQPTGKSARRYQHAFLSYAAADRKEVLKRAQVLKAAGVGFFQDILSLDPGARWEREIYRNIDGCDLFLLFWSRAARDSEWVIREAEYALARAGDGDVPDIVPVILEGPPVIKPPDSLRALHFNDQISYLMTLS